MRSWSVCAVGLGAAMALAAASLPGGARADEAYGRQDFDEDARGHWSFQPVERPALPAVARQEWVRTPVDAFILAGLEAKGLSPAPPAERRVLLRRIYFDLIGLPPTPDEQAAFLADDSPDAYERLVDDLLSRPQYGERWARHWLDVVRYAESNGYERDNAKPSAWRYRDWTIAAFNTDKPLARFIVEQLAGDELPDTSAEAQIATSFLRLGPWDDEPADPLADRYDQLDDVLGTTSAAFLGLTLRCARCHDHKFEPLTQRDYARVLAIFEPLKRPQENREDLDRPVGTPDELAVLKTLTSRQGELAARMGELESAVCRRAMGDERLAAALPEGVPQEAVAAMAVAPAERNDEQKRLVASHLEKLRGLVRHFATADQIVEHQSWLHEYSAAKSRCEAAPRAYVWNEEGEQCGPTHVFRRGDPRQHDVEVAPGVPAVLVDAPPPPATPTGRSTGRRLQFARWLADDAHPLVPRVYVNRLWQHHFGNGIVSTENDFGVMGAAPSNQPLLDWLAAELISCDGSTKHLHRLIVLSSAYRMSSQADAAGLKFDPANRLIWRFPQQRLEAEALRDAVLSASGLLDATRGGPSIYPPIARAVLETQSRPGSGWQATAGPAAYRRGIYIFVKRTLLLPELEVLDFPCPDASCEQRMVSTVAPQALTMLNGQFMHAAAGAMAERLARDCGPAAAERIGRAFALALCREPSDAERAGAAEFVLDQRAQIEADAAAAGQSAAEAERRAWAALCLVLLNTNEFAYVQ